MDRNAIVREIAQLKNKLKFDPRDYKCENLSILTLTDAEYKLYSSPGSKANKRFSVASKNKREIKLNSKETSDDESYSHR